MFIGSFIVVHKSERGKNVNINQYQFFVIPLFYPAVAKLLLNTIC